MDNLPYGGDINKAMRARDIKAIKTITEYRDSQKKSKEPEPENPTQSLFPECNNEIDYISQEEWSKELPADIQITFYIDKNKTTTDCYNYNELEKWMNEPENYFANWIQNDPDRPIDNEGYGGQAGNIMILRLPDFKYITGFHKIQNNQKEYMAIPIHKNYRLGNRYSRFGVSQIHGALPGYTIYHLFKKDPTKTKQEDYVNTYSREMELQKDRDATPALQKTMRDIEQEEQMTEISNFISQYNMRIDEMIAPGIFDVPIHEMKNISALEDEYQTFLYGNVPTGQTYQHQTVCVIVLKLTSYILFLDEIIGNVAELLMSNRYKTNLLIDFRNTSIPNDLVEIDGIHLFTSMYRIILNNSQKDKDIYINPLEVNFKGVPLKLSLYLNNVYMKVPNPEFSLPQDLINIDMKGLALQKELDKDIPFNLNLGYVPNLQYFTSIHYKKFNKHTFSLTNAVLLTFVADTFDTSFIEELKRLLRSITVTTTIKVKVNEDKRNDMFHNINFIKTDDTQLSLSNDGFIVLSITKPDVEPSPSNQLNNSMELDTPVENTSSLSENSQLETNVIPESIIDTFNISEIDDSAVYGIINNQQEHILFYVFEFMQHTEFYIKIKKYNRDNQVDISNILSTIPTLSVYDDTPIHLQIEFIDESHSNTYETRVRFINTFNIRMVQRASIINSTMDEMKLDMAFTNGKRFKQLEIKRFDMILSEDTVPNYAIQQFTTMAFDTDAVLDIPINTYLPNVDYLMIMNYGKVDLNFDGMRNMTYMYISYVVEDDLYISSLYETIEKAVTRFNDIFIELWVPHVQLDQSFLDTIGENIIIRE